jgi:hypothetical protein
MWPAVIAGGLGLAGSIFGASEARRAQKEYDKAMAKKAAEFAKLQVQLQNMQDYQFARAELAAKRGERYVDKGFGEAIRSVERQLATTQRDIESQGRQASAAASQSMMDRGLYGTTVQDQAQRATRADTQRAVAQASSAAAGQKSQLAVARGQAKAQQLAMLAQMYPALAQMKTGTQVDMLKLMQSSGGQRPQSSGIGSALAGLGGQLLSGWAMGGFQGMGGGGGFNGLGTSPSGEVFQGPPAF